MRIAIFTDTTYPQPNGVAVHIDSIYRKLAKRGHTIGIFCPPINGQKPETRLRYYPLPSFSISTAFFKHQVSIAIPLHPAIKKALLKFDPDVVHIHTPYFAGLSGRYFSQKAHIPTVETFHGYIMDPGYQRVFGITHGQKLIGKVIWRFLVWGLNKTNLVIAPSTLVKNDLLAHGVMKDVAIIHSGLDLDRKKIDEKLVLRKSEKIKKSYSIGENVVLYFGRVSWEKSLDTLILAFSLVLNKIPDAQLLIVGDGPASDSLKKHADDLGISKNIIFLGFKPHEEIMTGIFFKLAKVFVNPSKTETQGITTIEAMAFGVPIIAVNCGGSAEVVGEYGILYEPDNVSDMTQEICRVLTDRKKREYLASQSFDRARDFSLNRTVNKIEGVYRKLL
jgi:1,2-diacylglycerol 3-alpha-glucosyltransferase